MEELDDNSVDSSSISIQRGRWHKLAQLLDGARLQAIEVDHSNSKQELIVSPYSIMPRRLWDLKINRVINYRMLHAVQSTIQESPPFWAVSHSWTRDMHPTWTAINQHQWAVPLPTGISLDSLRAELL